VVGCKKQSSLQSTPKCAEQIGMLTAESTFQVIDMLTQKEFANNSSDICGTVK